MKRFFLAAGVALGIFAISTTTANTNYGTPVEYNDYRQDTTPKDTTKKDTTGKRRDSIVMPASFQR